MDRWELVCKRNKKWGVNTFRRVRTPLGRFIWKLSSSVFDGAIVKY